MDTRIDLYCCVPALYFFIVPWTKNAQKPRPNLPAATKGAANIL
jgi:hypothetical protein